MSAELIVAIAGVGAALSIPLTAFVRRPSVELLKDQNGDHSRVETTMLIDHIGDERPYLRIMVRNKRWRRSATEARVVVDRVRSRGGVEFTLGCPELAWTSHFEDTRPTIFSNWHRPLDFGQLINPSGNAWQLQLTLAKGMTTGDHRETLEACDDGYCVTLTTGAADSRGRTYEVDVNWNPHAKSATDAAGRMRP